MPHKTLKKRKLKKRTYKKQGGRNKELWCSQSIHREPLTKSVKICRKKKENSAIEKEMAKLNKEYYAFLDKTCKADDYVCRQKHREGNPLFDHLIKLETKSGKMLGACINKYCNRKELDRLLDDCIHLGEEQCRIKYADLIKKSKKKILPLEKCIHNL